MTINKTINTNVLQYTKTVVLVAVITAVGAFWFGMQAQKSNTPTVENRVVVQAVADKEAAPVK